MEGALGSWLPRGRSTGRAAPKQSKTRQTHPSTRNLGAAGPRPPLQIISYHSFAQTHCQPQQDKLCFLGSTAGQPGGFSALWRFLARPYKETQTKKQRRQLSLSALPAAHTHTHTLGTPQQSSAWASPAPHRGTQRPQSPPSRAAPALLPPSIAPCRRQPSARRAGRRRA